MQFELDSVNIVGVIYHAQGTNYELVVRSYISAEKLMEDNFINFMNVALHDSEPIPVTIKDTRTDKSFSFNSQFNKHHSLISTRWGAGTVEIYENVQNFLKENPTINLMLLAWDRCKFDDMWRGSRVAGGDPLAVTNVNNN